MVELKQKPLCCIVGYILFSLPFTVTVIKPRRMGWAGRVQRIEEVINIYKILVRDLEGRNRLRDYGVVGRKVLK
jgi:hypothetical protein